MRLSERLGVNAPRVGLQGREMDETTRNRLWSAVLQATPEARGLAFENTWMHGIYQKIWADFFKIPVDEMSDDERTVRESLKEQVLKGPWYTGLELIEFLLNDASHGNSEQLAAATARILDEEKAAFRLVAKRFVEVTDEREIAAVEEAMELSKDAFSPVRQHLEAAIRLYSDKRAPDYRNSIKESISAVEAAVQILTGDAKAELGKAISMLSSKAPLHGAFAAAIKSLYGYTSDANGIRHALSDEASVDAADVKFMLVACAAFVVYLRQKAAK